jgi:hypothetical protein
MALSAEVRLLSASRRKFAATTTRSPVGGVALTEFGMR